VADPIRIAAIGVGRLGMLHATNLATRVPGASLALVVDADPHAARAAGELLDVPHDTLFTAALADAHIDAVEICTASDSHAELIVAAANAGKSIFCEKPIALNLEDADQALAAVSAAGVTLQIGHMRRYDRDFREAKRLICEGNIGRPLTFRSASLDAGISSSREFLERCGGIFVDVGLHDFDLARWLMDDDVTEVFATGAVLVHDVLREVGDVDNVVATLRFARGGLGIVQVSHTAAYGYDIHTEVQGDKGAVRAGGLRGNDLWRFEAGGRVVHDTIPGFHERFAKAYLDELVEFVQCLQQGASPAATGSDARAALAIALAARQSLADGQSVPIG
jgi:scyllo-inositol 2-dehydrogenase (NAD+)